MYVHLPHPFQAAAKDTFRLFVCAADQEKLAVFNDMGKIVVRGAAPVAETDGRRAVPGGAGRIGHLAEGAVFIAFPAGLDDEVDKPPVQDGIKGVYVSLVIAFWGHAAWRIESVRVIRVAENVQRGAVTGHQAVFPVKKVIFQLLVERQEQASEGPVLKLVQLPVKSRFGRRCGAAAKICVNLLADAFPFHGLNLTHK